MIGGVIRCITLEFKEVLAARNKLPLSFKSTGVDISVRYSTAFAEARMNDSAMIVGCIPAREVKYQVDSDRVGGLTFCEHLLCGTE